MTTFVLDAGELIGLDRGPMQMAGLIEEWLWGKFPTLGLPDGPQRVVCGPRLHDQEYGGCQAGALIPHRKMPTGGSRSRSASVSVLAEIADRGVVEDWSNWAYATG